MPCWILVPQNGIIPMPLDVEVQHSNHWTDREFPEKDAFKEYAA